MDPEAERVLADLSSKDAAVRYRAWKSAAAEGTPIIGRLVALLDSPDRAAVKAAKGALENVVHAAGRDRRTASAASDELLKAARPGRSRAARSEVIHLLGFVGSSRSVPPLAALLRDPEVSDDARLALEQIPGSESLDALRRAIPGADPVLRLALEQSLRARSFTPQSVGRSPAR